jgi:importin subunit alpha-1
MDAYFPDDEEETGVADAPVDASGAFALSDVQAPTGGFQFVSVDDEDS